jgi:CubicO group peptidase (beta-lactamase class C family)
MHSFSSVALSALALVAFVVPLKADDSSSANGRLAPVLRGLVDHKITAGVVVLVANEEKVLDLEAAGFSSLNTKAPMKTDAVFWIASMTKSLTGAALMMLVDEGKVKLDDPVEKYLPEFKGQMVKEENSEPHPPKHPITIREVMDHTSGLIKANDPAFKKTSILEQDVKQIAALPLIREPGTKFEYNNSGINTGGRVIEVVSGMPYAEFMQKRLFDPLGMKETTFWPNEELGKRLASTTKTNADKTGLDDIDLGKGLTPAGIEKFAKGVKVPQEVLTNFGGGILPSYGERYGEPAGGLFSTASDIGRFCQMLLNWGTWQGKRYLSVEAIKQMSAVQTGDVPVNPQEGYGVGWFVKIRDDEGPSVGSYGHRGARKTVMWVDPKNHLATVLMVQCWELTGDQTKELYQGVLKAVVEKFGRRQ